MTDRPKRFLSYYTHLDGTRWAGPDYWADSVEEAQALAMEYPIQPITIYGEHQETIIDGDGVTERYFRDSGGAIH